MQLVIRGFTQPLLKRQSKMCPSVRHNLLLHSMQTDYKVTHIGQSIHNYSNGIISQLSSQRSHDKIHGNFFPLPLRHLQRLQQSSRSLMFSLDSLTSVAKSNILGNVSLHSIPPISGLEIMVHLMPSWMNGISRHMCFMKYLILQLLNARHTNPSFVPQYSFLMFQKVRRLLSLDNALNLLDLLIFYLTFLNLLK
jgi:hypothetical protein